MELIVTHTSTDFDAAASMVAARKLFPAADIALSGSLNRNVREFLSFYMHDLRLVRAREVDMELVKRLVIVDTQDVRRLGRFAEAASRPGVKKVIFDHHPVRSPADPDTERIVRKAGATTTVVVRRVLAANLPITPLEATLFVAGIYEDTGCLLYSETTPGDVRTVYKLLKAGADLTVVASFVNRGLDADQRSLFDALQRSHRVHRVHGLDIAIAVDVRPKFIEGLDTVVGALRDVDELRALFVAVAMGRKTYVVGRSRVPEVDAGGILRHLGGGGHPTAASAVARTEDPREVVNRLLELLEREVRPQLSVREIMSTPVKTIPAALTISDAWTVMSGFDYGGLPVMDGNQLVGIVLRADMEKAERHGLGGSKVTGYMNRSPVVVAPSVPVLDLQELMIRENASHLPVMEANQLVGIVTAQDVLRALHRTLAPPRTPAGPPERPPVHGAQLLERWLAPVQLDLVRRAGQLGDELKLGTYLIGGPVRDLLLGRGTQDLDLAVERDAHRLAQEFQARHGGKLVLHDHYRTATLGVQGHKIDFVTTRREYYEFPAARPRVDIQDVKLDLYRRDFTINAMAMRLDARHFGDLIDYYGGWRDLELKRVRVIHNLSFVDDPTRIFRALRFAGRLDFQLDGNTAALMQEALEADMLARLEPEVLFEELVSCTKEGAAERVFRLMIECGVLASLAREPGAGAGAIDRLPVIAAHLAELEQLIERFRDRAYPWLHQTLLAEPQRRQKVAERVFVPPRWLQWAESHPADLEALRAAGPAELKPLLMSRLSPPRVIALATDAPDQWPRILAAFRASSAGRRGPVVS